MRTVVFTRPRDPDRCLHVETPLGIVNIRVGLHDNLGRRVDSIQVIPNQYAGEPAVHRAGLANTRLVELTEPWEPEPSAAVELIDRALRDAASFSAESEEEEHTDSGGAWLIIGQLQEALEAARKELTI